MAHPAPSKSWRPAAWKGPPVNPPPESEYVSLFSNLGSYARGRQLRDGLRGRPDNALGIFGKELEKMAATELSPSDLDLAMRWLRWLAGLPGVDGREALERLARVLKAQRAPAPERAL